MTSRRDGGGARPTSGPSDTALVEAARSGARWAQEALYRRYARMAHGLAFRLMPGDPDAEDLVQDAFVDALTHLDRLERPGAFGSWLGSIVIRTAHKRLRRRRLMTRVGLRRTEPLDVERFLSREVPPDVSAELQALYGVLHELPADARVAVVLRRVEGMTIHETAAALGVSTATVKRRVQDVDVLLARRFPGRSPAEGSAADATDEPPPDDAARGASSGREATG